MSRPRVKICCIANTDEARRAIRAGADAIGLVSAMPSGPGVIADESIREIAAAVPPPIGTFLLTSRQDAASIAEQIRHSRCNTVQICDRLIAGTYADLKAAVPGTRIVQVIHVCDEQSIAEAREAAISGADALLLDSGNPALATKQLGGTGRAHDWAISRAIVESCDVPVFLAGGLNPDNAARALHEVRPFGLDVCSGLRHEGRLDDAKLRAFFAAIHAAATHAG